MSLLLIDRNPLVNVGRVILDTRQGIQSSGVLDCFPHEKCLLPLGDGSEGLERIVVHDRIEHGTSRGFLGVMVAALDSQNQTPVDENFAHVRSLSD